MIIVMKSGVTEADGEERGGRVVELGSQPHTIHGEIKTVIAAVGEERGQADLRILEALETVEAVMPVQQPFKLASRETKSQPSEIPVNGISIGGKQIVVMAGPCSVESQSQMIDHVLDVVGVARAVDVRVVPVGRAVLDTFQGLKEQ